MRLIQNYPVLCLILLAVWSATYTYIVHQYGPRWTWLTGRKVLWLYAGSLLLLIVLASGLFENFGR